MTFFVFETTAAGTGIVATDAFGWFGDHCGRGITGGGKPCPYVVFAEDNVCGGLGLRNWIEAVDFFDNLGLDRAD